tara:strand:+ start:1017 stop:1628 length:612 start_codon:yes stop_codon:yes gene_type:complete
MIYSREEELKKTFLQIEKKYRLPEEITKKIYNIQRRQKNFEEDIVRFQQKNLILLHCLNTKGNQFDSWLQDWMKTYQEKLNNDHKDIYKNLLPDGKGCEWGIKHSYLTGKKPVKVGEGYPEFKDTREKLIIEINILGENNYLMIQNEKLEWCKSPLRTKILYLNTSPWEEIEMDYENYLEWKGSEHEDSWRLSIDNYGDSSFL